MKVLKYKYKRELLDRVFWNAFSFDWINLQKTNLVVGKNASGKTSLSKILYIFHNIFQPTNYGFTGELSLTLQNDKGDIYEYFAHGVLNNITEEVLKKNDQILVERKDNVAKIFSESEKKFSTIAPPLDKTVIQVRRDSNDYPYFEELANWSRGIFMYGFADIHPNSNNLLGTIKPQDIDDALSNLSIERKSSIIQDFNSLGYSVDLIDIETEGRQNVVYVREKGMKYRIRQNLLSQGMYRSLLLFIYLDFLIEQKSATLIIIDDLCEGLDFDRATILGKIIFRKMKERNVQFWATTNDFFLMNTVSIENWNIIKMSDGVITTYNFENSKSAFENFMFTGLNNFQLFASDYLNELS